MIITCIMENVAAVFVQERKVRVAGLTVRVR